MGHLTEQFFAETGDKAMYRKGGADYHTLRYVKWLEAKVEKFTSTNMPSAEIADTLRKKIKPYIVKRPGNECQVLFPLSKLDEIVESATSYVG